MVGACTDLNVCEQKLLPRRFNETSVASGTQSFGIECAKCGQLITPDQDIARVAAKSRVGTEARCGVNNG